MSHAKFFDCCPTIALSNRTYCAEPSSDTSIRHSIDLSLTWLRSNRNESVKTNAHGNIVPVASSSGSIGDEGEFVIVPINLNSPYPHHLLFSRDWRRIGLVPLFCLLVVHVAGICHRSLDRGTNHNYFGTIDTNLTSELRLNQYMDVYSSCPMDHQLLIPVHLPVTVSGEFKMSVVRLRSHKLNENRSKSFKSNNNRNQ